MIIYPVKELVPYDTQLKNEILYSYYLICRLQELDQGEFITLEDLLHTRGLSKLCDNILTIHECITKLCIEELQLSHDELKVRCKLEGLP